jgi:CheY-like chemotaxis protein
MTSQQKPLLVVEDNATVRFVVQLQLEQLGYVAEFAVNGEEAVAIANQTDYGLILMDVMMPVMDGLEATKHIRQQEAQNHKPRKPIVAMTACADENGCSEAGMDDFLLKPVLTDKLSEILRHWITKA